MGIGRGKDRIGRGEGGGRGVGGRSGERWID